MSKRDLVEKYGNPRLIWGYYPISEDYNLGGCVGGCGPSKLASSFDVARGEAKRKSMEQRGGNNAFTFQQHPGYTQHEIGTGCYNPNCHCYNCNGDCACDQKGKFVSHSPRDPITAVSGLVSGMQQEGMNDAFTWLGMIAVFYFVYNLFIKRR